MAYVRISINGGIGIGISISESNGGMAYAINYRRATVSIIAATYQYGKPARNKRLNRRSAAPVIINQA